MKNARNILLAGTVAAFLPVFSVAAVSISDVPLAVKNNVRTNFIFMLDDSASMGSMSPKIGNKYRIDIVKSASTAVLDKLPKDKSRVALVTFANAKSGYGKNGGELDYALTDLTYASLTDIKESIQQLSASNYTPLSETLSGIGNYLARESGSESIKFVDSNGMSQAVSRTDFFAQNNTGRGELVGASTATPAVQYWCQRSNIIVMTDGNPTEDVGLSDNRYLRDYDGDCSKPTSGCGQYDRKGTLTTENSHPNTKHPVGTVHDYEDGELKGSKKTLEYGSDYLDDVAQALHEVDLRPDLKPPPGKNKGKLISVYMIGFADSTLKNSPLMQEAAWQGGGGKLLFATDEAELTKTFQEAIDDAFSKENAAAAIAVVNPHVEVDDAAYASRYSSANWSGDLRAYRLDPSTGIPVVTPEKEYEWSAAKMLASRQANTRYVVTHNGSTVTSQPKGATFGNTATTGQSVAALRTVPLGDIVNAEPVIVKYPDGRTVVFQAANDGMLHAFEGKLDGGGTELFAYVPRALYTGSTPALSATTRPLASVADHKFLLDATPAVADIDGKKLLVGGLGKGGKAYYALDITSLPADPIKAKETDYIGTVKWEVTPPNAGFSFATPLMVNTSNGWRVVVPSGYRAQGDNGSGYVFLLDPADGSVKMTIPTGEAGDLAYLAKLQDAGAAAVVDVIYGGDTQGNLFRFNLKDGKAIRVAQLKDGSGVAQPVTSPPLVTAGSKAGEYKVFVGTGQYLDEADITSTQLQTLYGVIDDSSVAAPVLPSIRGSNGASCPTGGGDGAFVCQTLTGDDSSGYTVSANALGSKKGWYVDLPVSGSRIISQGALSRGGVLVYTANKPTNKPCEPGGTSYLLTVSPSNGGQLADKEKGMVKISTALGSRPVLVETADGERALVRHADQTFTSTKLWSPQVPGKAKFRVLSWRELL
ncbi:PilC/PilY family type IV pilus protein [Crenobacter intestini]|uniref:VWA domain-containing protein n=1 Tax=Crenobacter intestini TaxID=2563443 RepID=A0A4T0V6C3_9NEIS|nr:PilC/PilY family type IV pilus protein [Crenobacter intestini]TIC86987.1 VWA domain-containing protein [Crenobacter intestini]